MSKREVYVPFVAGRNAYHLDFFTFNSFRNKFVVHSILHSILLGEIVFDFFLCFVNIVFPSATLVIK